MWTVAIKFGGGGARPRASISTPTSLGTRTPCAEGVGRCCLRRIREADEKRSRAALRVQDEVRKSLASR